MYGVATLCGGLLQIPRFTRRLEDAKTRNSGKIASTTVVFRTRHAKPPTVLSTLSW